VLAHVFSFSNSTAYPMPRRRRLHAASMATTMPARTVLRALLVAGIGAVTIPVLSQTAFAAEWSATPSLRLSYEKNDNTSLTLQPNNTVYSWTIAPSLNMGVQSDVWGITGATTVTRKRYSGAQELDRDTETFVISSRYHTKRSNFAINASRVNDTTLTEDPEDPDLGRVTVQRSRRTESIQPSWSWSMTQRSQIQLSSRLSETSYAGGESIGLFDYQNHATTATWSYLLSPLSQFFLTANYSRYRVPDMSIQSQTIDGDFLIVSTISAVDSSTPSISAGFNHTFSATMQGTLMLGRRKTSSERAVTDCRFLFGVFFDGCVSDSRVTHDTGATFSGNLNKKFEKLNVAANVSRGLAVSGVGTETEADSLNIRLEYPYTARLKGTFTVSSNESRLITNVAGATSAATNIKQYSIRPALNWQWTREMRLGAAYQYRHIKRESEDQATQSRAIYLSLIYTWNKLSISR
jgi:hypothetical protein